MFYYVCLSSYVLLLLIFIYNGITSAYKIWWLKKPRGIDFPKLACSFVALANLNTIFWLWQEGRLGHDSLALSIAYLVRALTLAYLLRVINLRRKGEL